MWSDKCLIILVVVEATGIVAPAIFFLRNSEKTSSLTWYQWRNTLAQLTEH
jgi:hypothetical protein